MVSNVVRELGVEYNSEHNFFLRGTLQRHRDIRSSGHFLRQVTAVHVLKRPVFATDAAARFVTIRPFDRQSDSQRSAGVVQS